MTTGVQFGFCSVCSEIISRKATSDQKRPIKEVKCGNYFHQACILEWIGKQEDKGDHPSCPTCKRLIDYSTRGPTQTTPKLNQLETEKTMRSQTHKTEAVATEAFFSDSSSNCSGDNGAGVGFL